MFKFTQKINSIGMCRNLSSYNTEDVLYFDIETTGFSPASTMLYLIGCAYTIGGQSYIIQWLAESTYDESIIIREFLAFTVKFKALVHYNGNGFDIPYIIKKCEFLHIDCDFSGLESIDIYKIISPLRELFKTENLKQKSIEIFMNINRNDTYSGGELIAIYNRFLKTNDTKLKAFLLLHNKEDVEGMTRMLSVLNYSAISDKDYFFSSVTLSPDEKDAIIEIKLPYPLPKRVSYGNDTYYFTAFDTILRISIKIYSDELKYFYSDYKNYYYLPAEDSSIHKSVAFYVDKNYRTKAKAANCYSRKTGRFLPQMKEVISPYFKKDYYDKITYFELTDDIMVDDVSMLQYIHHIFSTLFNLRE